jgi:hypothetical protein
MPTSRITSFVPYRKCFTSVLLLTAFELKIPEFVKESDTTEAMYRAKAKLTAC